MYICIQLNTMMINFIFCLYAVYKKHIQNIRIQKGWSWKIEKDILLKYSLY